MRAICNAVVWTVFGVVLGRSHQGEDSKGDARDQHNRVRQAHRRRVALLIFDKAKLRDRDPAELLLNVAKLARISQTHRKAPASGSC